MNGGPAGQGGQGAERPAGGSREPGTDEMRDAGGEQRVPRIQQGFERGLALSRLLALIPVIFLLLDAAGSFIYGTDILVRAATDVVGEPAHIGGRLGLFLVVMDTFLVGATLMVAAFGFYELFIVSGTRKSQRHWLPGWLQMSDLEDLKVRVVSMLILVAAITFVDRMVESGKEHEVLFLGVGVSVVIIALTVFGWFSRRSLPSEGPNANPASPAAGTRSAEPAGAAARADSGVAQAPEPRRRARIIAIFSSTKREGSWSAAAQTAVTTVAGLARIDLREAILPGEQVTVSVLAAFGVVSIVIPPDMELAESGTTMLGIRSVGGRGAVLARRGAVPPHAASHHDGRTVLVLSDRSVLGLVRVIRKARPSADKEGRG